MAKKKKAQPEADLFTEEASSAEEPPKKKEAEEPFDPSPPKPDFLYSVCAEIPGRPNVYKDFNHSNNLNQAKEMAKLRGMEDGVKTRVFENWSGFVYRYPEDEQLSEEKRKK